MTTAEPASVPAHRPMLAVARAEVLFASPLSAANEYDTVDLRYAIRETLHLYGSVRACAAVMAAEFGEHPEQAASRMRWARTVAAPLSRP